MFCVSPVRWITRDCTRYTQLSAVYRVVNEQREPAGILFHIKLCKTKISTLTLKCLCARPLGLIQELVQSQRITPRLESQIQKSVRCAHHTHMRVFGTHHVCCVMQGTYLLRDQRGNGRNQILLSTHRVFLLHHTVIQLWSIQECRRWVFRPAPPHVWTLLSLNYILHRASQTCIQTYVI